MLYAGLDAGYKLRVKIKSFFVPLAVLINYVNLNISYMPHYIKIGGRILLCCLCENSNK